MIDETESDDEWYTQMEQAAFAAPCDEEVNGADNCSADDDENCVSETEEEYYERMNITNCTVSDSIFQSEKSSVWYTLMQQSLRSQQDTSDITNSSFGLMKLSEKDAIAIDSVNNFLFGNLPKSSHLCGIVSNYVKVQSGTNVFVDHLVHPSIVVAFKVIHLSKTLEVSCYASINNKDVNFIPISRIMTQMLIENNLSEVMFSGLESGMYDAFKAHDRLFNEIWVDDCGLYANMDNISSEVQTISLPAQFSFDDLSCEDADVINNTWKYKTKHSIHMVKDMINSQRCVGIRYTPLDTVNPSNVLESQLVAWCLTYRYGAIGMLYTSEKHRKKGLANAVVRELIRRSSTCSSSHHHAPPFCYIESSNQASKNLFCAQLGFSRQSDVLWVGLKPKI